MSDSARLPSEGEFPGDFELGEVLSEVEYGTVYAASRRSDGLGAAVTVVAPELTTTTPGMAERFLAALAGLDGLDHAHLVPIHAMGTTEAGLPWLASDLIAGRPLTALLEEEKSLPASRVVAIGDQLLSALGALHERGVIHGGLTPGSVIVTETADGSDHVKILCLGTKAHLRSAAGKAADTVLALDVNDARYAAPEQLRGEPTSPATDLYSLTLLLIEMLSGQPAMQGATIEAVRMRQIAGKPKLSPSLSKSPLVAALARALVKDPAKRFESAAELAAQLDKVRDKLVDEPVAAKANPAAPAAPATGGTSINALRERLMAARQKIDAASDVVPAVDEADSAGSKPVDAPTVVMSLDKLKDESKHDASPARPQPGSELDLPAHDSTVKMPEDALAGALAAAGELKLKKGEQGAPTVQSAAIGAGTPATDERDATETSDVVSMDSSIVELDADDSALLDLADVNEAAAQPPSAPPPVAGPPSVIDADSTQPVAAEMLAALPAPGRAIADDADEDDAGNAVGAPAAADTTTGTMLGMAPLTADPRATPHGADEGVEDSDGLLAPMPATRPLWVPIAVGVIGVGLAILVGVLLFGGDGDEEASQAEAAETDEVTAEVAEREPDELAEDEAGASDERMQLAADPDDAALPVDDTEHADAEPLQDGEMGLDGTTDDLAGVETAAVEAPTAVLWTLTSTPEGAVVTDEADAEHVLCDATPCEVELTVGDAPLTLSFALDGHEAHRETVVPSVAGQLDVELVAMAEPEPEPEPRSKPKKKRKKKKKKKKTDPFGGSIYTD